MSEEQNLANVNKEKGLSTLQKALEAKNVKVDAQTLKDAVTESHKAILVGCEQCANGWHW
ncbi:MAG: hypothetical protein K8R25_18765 [Methanosarcinales archaeon]|nr:hypothetical protein [Methanosarcinales archaeon]